MSLRKIHSLTIDIWRAAEEGSVLTELLSYPLPKHVIVARKYRGKCADLNRIAPSLNRPRYTEGLMHLNNPITMEMLLALK